MANNIIDALITPKRAQRLYNFLSPFYDYLTRYERLSKERGLEVANIKPGQIVFEGGFGTGHTLMEIAMRVGKVGRIYGLDISLGMIKKTKKRIKKRGLARRVDLQLGDARKLPYKNAVFDVVYNSYMLDLIDTHEIPQVLLEFRRVLKPRGRLILVNMSKGMSRYTNMKLYEWIYSKCPSLLGGCRPVLSKPFLEELGCHNVQRECILAGHLVPSEIVWGEKQEIQHIKK
jgi:demethylmenaquinone methyltransferase/2-methoxy-6-polyprenyl-1,4-benzoquinol methylase